MLTKKKNLDQFHQFWEGRKLEKIKKRKKSYLLVKSDVYDQSQQRGFSLNQTLI